jgi:hypothetical protein
VGVEASHYYSAAGIEPVLRLLGLTANSGSRATYRHYAAEAHYLEYRKNASDQGVGDRLGPDDQISGDQLQQEELIQIASGIELTDEEDSIMWQYCSNGKYSVQTLYVIINDRG